MSYYLHMVKRNERQKGDIKILFVHERSYEILRGGIVLNTGERLQDIIE